MRVSMKDYAAQKNVTYEAVRQQVKRYKEELKGHIFVEGRTRFLDEFAVEFLDEKRNKSPVTVITNNYADELAAAKDEIEALKQAKAALEAENKRLLVELASTQKALIAEQAEVKKLLAPPEQAEKKGFFAKLFGG